MPTTAYYMLRPLADAGSLAKALGISVDAIVDEDGLTATHQPDSKLTFVDIRATARKAGKDAVRNDDGDWIITDPEGPAAGGDGWIPHTPGACPVPGDTKVRARFWNGAETDYTARAGSLLWHVCGHATIVAYKIVNPAEALQPDPNAWTDADGKQPVEDGVVVDVILRSGEQIDQMAAGRRGWEISASGKDGDDIVKWRRSPPGKTADGWTKHVSQEMPVDGGTYVQVRDRDGDEIADLAENLDWFIDDLPGDIVAYRKMHFGEWQENTRTCKGADFGDELPDGLSGDTLVRVELRDGQTEVGEAGGWVWPNDPEDPLDADILRYQVLEPDPDA